MSFCHFSPSSAVDTSLSNYEEYVKSIVREAFNLTARIIDGTCKFSPLIVICASFSVCFQDARFSHLPSFLL